MLERLAELRPTTPTMLLRRPLPPPPNLLMSQRP
jgi:hypothetical protein